MRQWECTHGVRTRQRNASARAMQRIRKREPALVLVSESLQYEEGREEEQGGRQHSKQMVVEWLTAPEP